MPPLYELTKEFQQIVDQYNSAQTQEELDQIEKVLGDLQISLNDKAIAVGHFVTNTQGDILAIDAEIERLAKMKKSRENAVKFFKGYLQTNMTIVGLKKVESPTLKILIQKNPPSVVIIDEEQIPEKYIRTKVVKSVNKIQIIADWKETGVGVAGTEVAQGERLVIK